MNLSNNGTTAIVVIAGLAYLGYLFSIDSERALTQAPLVIGAVFGLAQLLHQGAIAAAKADVAADKADVAAVKATAAAVQSKENSALLVENTTKTEHIDGKTDRIHTMVDGQLTAMRDEVRQLQGIVSQLLQGRAATDATRLHSAPIALPAPPSVADAAAIGAAQAVRDVGPDASAGEIADAAALGAADATEAKP